MVEFAIEAGAESPVRGTQMFREMLQQFGNAVKAVAGRWTYGDNLAEVNRLTAAGTSLEDAAKATWTGRRCIEEGFTKAVVETTEGTSGNFTKVYVRFEKP